MNSIEITCPFCSAKLPAHFEDTKIYCKFCRSTINRELNEEEKSAIAREKELSEIRQVLDARMQLSIIQQKREDLRKEEKQVEGSAFRMPIIDVNIKHTSHLGASAFSTVMSGIFMIIFFCISAYKVGLFFLCSTTVCFFIAKKFLLRD